MYGHKVFGASKPWIYRYAFVHIATKGEMDNHSDFETYSRLALDSIHDFSSLADVSSDSSKYHLDMMTPELAGKTYAALETDGMLRYFETPGESHTTRNASRHDRWKKNTGMTGGTFSGMLAQARRAIQSEKKRGGGDGAGAGAADKADARTSARQRESDPYADAAVVNMMVDAADGVFSKAGNVMTDLGNTQAAMDFARSVNETGTVFDAANDGNLLTKAADSVHQATESLGPNDLNITATSSGQPFGA